MDDAAIKAFSDQLRDRVGIPARARTTAPGHILALLAGSALALIVCAIEVLAR